MSVNHHEMFFYCKDFVLNVVNLFVRNSEGQLIYSSTCAMYKLYSIYCNIDFRRSIRWWAP